MILKQIFQTRTIRNYMDTNESESVGCLPDKVTSSNNACTVFLSTDSEPDVGPLLTSTTIVATPSLLPSFTVNLKRYLDPLLRSRAGMVRKAKESPLGIYSSMSVKLLMSTKEKPGQAKKELSHILFQMR